MSIVSERRYVWRSNSPTQHRSFPIIEEAHSRSPPTKKQRYFGELEELSTGTILYIHRHVSKYFQQLRLDGARDEALRELELNSIVIH
jgi:hypothetical protein